MRLAVAIVLLVTFAAEARRTTAFPRTAGLGRSCKKSSDCRSRAQRCLKESDMNGKPIDQGFCALPCLPLEAGTTKVIPGQPLDASPKNLKKKNVPPRCPPHYLCRGADSGAPIDMCVKE